jgi:pimeloyl-ACP methyl ester carboxylesterase
MMSFRRLKKPSSRHYFASHVNVTPHAVSVGAAVVVATFAISALVNRFVAKKAERNNPPMGKFIEIEGVRLHYFERGEGEPLVLLHGSGSMIQDFSSSGLVDKAAGKYRVIVFDRPGFGYSERPRRTIWTPEAQANLICKALRQIGISRAIVLGHSWGASVATALALKYPEMVAGLVLASGYYYPTVRGEVVLLSGPRNSADFRKRWPFDPHRFVRALLNRLSSSPVPLHCGRTTSA